jgi:outer membrane protein assembly factor BamB
MIRLAATLLFALLVTGCSIFGDDDEPIDPPAELQDFDASLRVQKVWDIRVGDGTEYLMLDLAPVVDGGRVFAGAHDGRVVAADAQTGRRVWNADTKLELSSGPSVGDGLVVFGTSDGDVIALDALEGSERWRASVAGEILAAPAIGGGTVIVRSVDGKLRSLDAADGSIFWTIEQQVPRLTLRGTSSPAVMESAVIAGFDNGRIAAYDVDDGDVRWENVVAPPSGKTELERLADIDASILAVGQDVYTSSYNGRVASIAAESGQVLWSQDVASYRGLGADWSNVYASDQTGHVIAMSRASGAVLWSQEALHMRRLTSPIASGDSVVVGDFEGYMHWLNVGNGELEGRSRADKTPIYGRLASDGELVFAQTESGRLVAFRARRPDSG